MLENSFDFSSELRVLRMHEYGNGVVSDRRVARRSPRDHQKGAREVMRVCDGNAYASLELRFGLDDETPSP